ADQAANTQSISIITARSVDHSPQDIPPGGDQDQEQQQQQQQNATPTERTLEC
ncbi:MAG: hypothetical protein JWP54_1602, partial [Cryobacterium sp.]|nr:hypothetical protein [Cryobacterium sp.]